MVKLNPEKCIFREEFFSAAEVSANGGTLINSPTINRGATLTGTEYITYNIPNTLFDKSTLSLVVEFTPDFENTDGSNHQITDGTNGERVALYKSSIGNLVLYVNGSSILASTSAEYGSFWNTGKRNVVVATFTSGSNKMYLNGHQIDSTTSSFTQAKPTEFYIRATFAGTIPFEGIIHSVSVHNRILTLEDSIALYNRSMFNFY